jgi:hypothetical protein
MIAGQRAGHDHELAPAIEPTEGVRFTFTSSGPDQRCRPPLCLAKASLHLPGCYHNMADSLRIRENGRSCGFGAQIENAGHWPRPSSEFGRTSLDDCHRQSCVRDLVGESVRPCLPPS